MRPRRSGLAAGEPKGMLGGGAGARYRQGRKGDLNLAGRRVAFGLGLYLHQLDRIGIKHLSADALSRVEVDERLVAERITQDTGR